MLAEPTDSARPRPSLPDEREPYRRIVVKVGTTLLTHESDRLNMQVMASLVEQTARLHQAGAEVILVSSGAMAAGRHVLGMPRERKGVPFKQVLAAAGQGRLMHAYEQLFDWHEIPVAQALLTPKDLNERLGWLNIRNTLLGLLELRVVPIINENDVVAVDELVGDAFGDNDNLSALVANLVNADLLVLLGEMEGLYTADPHVDPNARLIPRVERVDGDIQALGGVSWGDRGRGGMATKLEAAGRATSCGVDVIIASGLGRRVLERLVQGEHIGTFFPATTTKLESRKRWMNSGPTRGSIVIDRGACKALLGSGSLLPAGVTEVRGGFQRGDILSVLASDGSRVAVGVTSYGSEELDKIKGSQSTQISGILGHHYGDEVVHRNNMMVLGQES